MSGARDRSCSLVVSCRADQLASHTPATSVCRFADPARHMMESSMQGIEVLIVDPHQLWCEGLKLLLAGEIYEVIGAAASLDAALLEIEAGVRPRLLVTVVQDCGETFSIATLQRIRAIVPQCKIVLIANNLSSSLLARATDWEVNALLRSNMSRDI